MANDAAGTGGIIPRKYKSGSIIYFENDKSEYIYILKSGRVVLTSRKLDTGEEVKEEVRQGEFFGVKSSLGKYPREETAQTIGETVVLVLNVADFERLILRNVNVVRKMLRVFSNQLRRIGKMVRSVLGQGDSSINPMVELFRIGEYYYRTGVYQQARYAYKKYLEYYPDTQYASQAMERIRSIDSGAPMPAVSAPEAPAAASGKSNADDDMDDFGSGGEEESEDFFNEDAEPGSKSSKKAPAASSPLSSEMDDFLSDSGSGGADESLDDFGMDDLDGGPLTSSSIQDDFYKANELFNSGDFAQASTLYREIIDAGSPASPEDDELFENAHFELGRCQNKMGMQREALEAFSAAIKRFPKSVNVKSAYFHIGSIFESAKQAEKAKAYYKRAADMPPADKISEQAAKRLARL